MINQPLDKIFDKKLLSIFKRVIEKGEEIYSEQLEILTTNGIIYVLLTVKPYFYKKDDKLIKSAIAILQDITKQKRAEQLYQNTMARKQKLLDLLPDTLLLVNKNGEILEAHLPYAPEKELGIKHISDLLPKYSINMFLNEINLAIKRKTIRKFVFNSSKEGQLLARIIPDKTDNALIVISQIPGLAETQEQKTTIQIQRKPDLEAKEKYHKDLEFVIENELIPIYQNLQRAISFVLLKNFIDHLEEIASKFNLPDLNDYAKKLNIATEEFDIEQVNKLLSEFPVIINKFIGYETINI